MLQYATRISKRGSCATFRKIGEEYCTTCEATTSRRWRESPDMSFIAAPSNATSDAGASRSELPFSTNAPLSVTSRLIYALAARKLTPGPQRPVLSTPVWLREYQLVKKPLMYNRRRCAGRGRKCPPEVSAFT